MSPEVCGRCDATGQLGNFCTACGYDLRPAEAVVLAPRHRQVSEPARELLTCPHCGALNASSRRACARCRGLLSGEPAPAPAGDASHAGFGPALRAVSAHRSPKLLHAVVAAAAVVVLAVTGSLLAARGAGPFTRDEPVAPSPGALLVRSARASSAREGEPPGRLLDADPATAWVEGAAGPGIGQWVELRLGASARVGRLTVWNGDQRGARFLVRNRVRELRIDADGARFTVELLDVRGPQVVELPRPVDTDRMRLTILSVHGATPDADTALSDVLVYGTPAG